MFHINDPIMKKFYILHMLFAIGLSSCYVEEGEGIPGPQGPSGFDGIDGEEAYVFEYEMSFTAPDYSALLTLPSDFAMLDSDVMLVYLLWEIANDGTEIWRLLPQTLYLSEDIVTYNYDFTKYDASLFMDGTINLDVLGADFTDNWIARIVVVPGQFSGRSTLDYSDYHAVIAHFELSSSKLANSSYKKRPE